MIANSGARSGSLSAKLPARHHARFTALVGTGVMISAIAMSARSSIVPQSETLRSISPSFSEILRISRTAAAAIDVERAMQLFCLMLAGVLATVLGFSSLPRLAEMTGYLSGLAATTKRSAVVTVSRRLRGHGAAAINAAFDWASRHCSHLIYSIIAAVAAVLVIHRPEAVECTIGDFLEWLRECFVPDLVYCGGSVVMYCSGWR